MPTSCHDACAGQGAAVFQAIPHEGADATGPPRSGVGAASVGGVVRLGLLAFGVRATGRGARERKVSTFPVASVASVLKPWSVTEFRVLAAWSEVATDANTPGDSS